MELGSGCGSTGILAAQIAPASTVKLPSVTNDSCGPMYLKVVLTDNIASVLENLRMCCRLNLPTADVDRELECVIEQMNDDSIEALSCEEATDVSLDEFLVASSPWDAANMAIRFLSWDGASPSSESRERSKDPLPPPLAKDDAFDVILGSEILYEEQHAWQVPDLIRQRLAHGGRCLIAGAVRENVVPATRRSVVT